MIAGAEAFAILLGAALGVGPRPSAAVRILHSVEVSTDEPGARHVESVLAVNPKDPRSRIAAAMVLDGVESVAVYATRDAGRTWTRATYGERRNSRFDGLDPAVAFDTDGSAYFLSIGSRLQVWKSTDGGFQWTDPVVVPGRAWDRPWIACAPSAPGASAGRIYVAGKLPVTVFGHSASDIIGLSVSEDGGRSFPFPRLFLPAPDKEVLNVVGDLLVTREGDALLALQLFPLERLGGPMLAGSYATAVSGNGGRSLTPPRPGLDFRTFGHAWEGKSLYGLGGARFAIDASGGARNGRLYAAWLDASDGFHRVMTASSSDSGASWSAPLPISDLVTETDASTPVVAVDSAGVVAIAWYDRRADPGNGCYQPYVAVSSDGGVSFSNGEPLDTGFTCPLASGPGVGGPPRTDSDAVSSEYRFKNGGDTQGLVGLSGGGFELAWIRAGTNEMQLWSTAFETKPAPRKP